MLVIALHEKKTALLLHATVAAENPQLHTAELMLAFH